MVKLGYRSSWATITLFLVDARTTTRSDICKAKGCVSEMFSSMVFCSGVGLGTVCVNI